jgi:hypothetical protein
MVREESKEKLGELVGDYNPSPPVIPALDWLM